MPEVLNIDSKISEKLKKYGLDRKFAKQIALFANNPNHPSLHTELLEPRQHGIYSFRIDRKYRALFVYREADDVIEVIAITVHYR